MLHLLRHPQISVYLTSVQLAGAKFKRTFSSFPFRPFGLQLFPPLFPLLLVQLSLTKTWVVKKR